MDHTTANSAHFIFLLEFVLCCHIYFLLTYILEISTVWYVLPCEAVCVFDATYLPWCMRIGKGIFAMGQFSHG